jgi:oligopeptide/dipeptide ABC transporter ATP-binding protein
VTAPLLEVEGLTKHFGVGFGRRRSVTRAAEDVSFSVGRGEIVGLIGESGSGKSTVGRSILRLEAATSGSIRFEGEEVLAFGPRDLRRYRRRVQAVFQDPASSLDPLLSVRDIVGEPMAAHGVGDKASRETRVVALLAQVGLGPDVLRRRPHAFSGGQRQRIAIARALAIGPDLIVADEPVSALDVSVQAQVINLLQRLRQDLGLALLFISHDLATVAYLCDRVVVMYMGRVMEIAPAAAFASAPLHPYSRRLLADAPKFGGALGPTSPEPPVPADRATGCVFRRRCAHAIDLCGRATPALTPAGPGRGVACVRPELFA